jgi:CRISPR/Cas system CSM-associated protein Csm5 (group 7 of RAMP superfamily)
MEQICSFVVFHFVEATGFLFRGKLQRSEDLLEDKRDDQRPERRPSHSDDDTKRLNTERHESTVEKAVEAVRIERSMRANANSKRTVSISTNQRAERVS